jgi:hypothetical protein
MSKDMENKKSPNKIKRETQIYYHEKNSLIKWGDIKHLQLEDDDIIRSGWEDDEGGGDYYGEITRTVEETDEQFQKRQSDIERDNKWMKERRYESYLKLKKEFETNE